jgi:hypothetical protein
MNNRSGQQIDPGKNIIQILLIQHHPVVIRLPELFRLISAFVKVFVADLLVEPVNKGYFVIFDLKTGHSPLANDASGIEKTGDMKNGVVDA